MPLLEMKHICKAFSGVYANDHVDFSVEKGEIHALLGENGAGKTTLVNILFGLYEADEGEIFWKGAPVSFASPKEAIEAGIGMVQQHFSLVRHLSVLDNVLLHLKDNRFLLRREEAKKRLLELAGHYGLSVSPHAKISELSVGEQQRVEILKALYKNVELLILDEPTGVLTPQETAYFFEVLRHLRTEGYGIIIITHRMSEIMAISDRVTILRDGKKAAALITKETNPAQLSRYMIGRELKEGGGPQGEPQKEALLVVKNVRLAAHRHNRPLNNITFRLRKGEILGVAGVEGNGQKELAEVMAGIRKPEGGEVFLNGENITHKTVRSRYLAGISYISDDRQKDSLIPDMSIAENLLLKTYYRSPFAAGGVIRPAAVRKNAVEKCARYQVKASGSSGDETPVRLLSGGNQQKLIIARELERHIRLVIAAQPTRGLDIGATEFVRGRLLEQRNSGKSVLLISADLEEILALSDRIAVLFGGEIAGILAREEATVEKIGLLMGGISEHGCMSRREAANEAKV